MSPVHGLPLWESRCPTQRLTHWSVLRLLPWVQSSSSPALLGHKGTHELNVQTATILCWFNIQQRRTEEFRFLSCAVLLTVMRPLQLYIHTTLWWADRWLLTFRLYWAAASRPSQISAHTNTEFKFSYRKKKNMLNRRLISTQENKMKQTL